MKFSSKTVNYTIFLFILFWFSHAYTQALVEADWLDGKTCIKNLVVLEVHRGKKNYELEHIPCSVYTNFYENILLQFSKISRDTKKYYCY